MVPKSCKVWTTLDKVRPIDIRMFFLKVFYKCLFAVNFVLPVFSVIMLFRLRCFLKAVVSDYDYLLIKSIAFFIDKNEYGIFIHFQV